MRLSTSDIDLKGAALTLVVIAIVLALGLQVLGMDIQDPYETEHYNQSQEWCSSENGSLALMNDAAVSEHNGFHCMTDGTTYHMHRVADLNYTHDKDRLENTCGTTHGNTPFFIGCNITTHLLLVLVILIALVFIVYLSQYYRTD